MAYIRPDLLSMLKIGAQRIPLTTVTLVISESALIVLALALATIFRFLDPNAIEQAFKAGAVFRFGLVIVICQLTLYYYDMYDLQAVSRRSAMFVQLMQALGVSCLLLGVIYYIHPQLSIGRGIAMIAAPTIFILVVSWRLALDSMAPLLRPSERVLILGMGSSGLAAVSEIASRPELSYKVIGFLGENPAAVGSSISHVPVIAETHEVLEVVRRERIERVVISLGERRGRMPVQNLLRLKFQGIHIEDAHSLFERITGRIMLEHLNPSWFILSDGFRRPRLTVWIKRAIDLFISTAGLILTFPMLALTAFAIWAEDRRPILFRQTRVGLNGKQFQMLKFRSMRQARPGESPSWTSQNDSRITHVGKIIRRYRLDELPQLINVLRGDMSLVGPRPEQPYFCELLEEKIAYFSQRHTVRPGITGWAQIKSGYGASVEQAQMKLEHDLFYIKHLSTSLDLAIIFETFKVMLSGRGAA